MSAKINTSPEFRNDSRENLASAYESGNISIELSKTFNNPDFGNLSIFVIDGEPWFYGREVAQRLGYINPSNAVVKYVKESEKLKVKASDFQAILNLGIAGGTPGTSYVLIKESGFYKLVMKSKLQSAEMFQNWVTEEVLPSIRKTGRYAVEKRQDGIYLPNFNDPAEAAEAWAKQVRENRRLALLAESESKRANMEKSQKEMAIQTLRDQSEDVSIARSMVDYRGVLIRDLSKRLMMLGINIARNNLYLWMMECKIIFRTRDCWEASSMAIKEGLAVPVIDTGNENFYRTPSVRISSKGLYRLYKWATEHRYNFDKYGRIMKEVISGIYDINKVINDILSISDGD